MEPGISNILLTVLGWIFLFLKYRNIGKMKEAKKQSYDGSFVVAGRTVAMQFVLVLLGLLTLMIALAIFSGELVE